MRDSWKKEKIDELVISFLDFRGKTPLKLGMNWGGGDIRALSANNVGKGKVNFEKECYYASEALYKKWMNKGDCERGDVLLTMEAPLGNVAQIPDDKKYILSQRTVLLKFKTSLVDKDFMYYLFCSEEFQRKLNKHSTGSTVTGIQQKKLSKIAVQFPKLVLEQKKIAKILSTCDEVIEQTEAAITKYQALKQGMMHDLFTRGIDLKTGKLRPTFEEAPELYKESELGIIPKEWEVKEFREFFRFISYGFTNPMPELEEGPYMVTAANVKNGKINYSTTRKTSQSLFKEILTDKSRPKIGDLLLTKDGTLGRVALVDKPNICINQSVAVIRFNENENPNFFKILLETPLYHKKMIDDAGGSTIKHIYITIVDKMLLGVPKDQSERNIIELKIETVNSRIETEQSTLSKYQQLKAGLMQDLLTGKVEVSVEDEAIK